MSNVTKKLPQLQQYRPYKYNEVRRKFRMGQDGRKGIGSIEEEEYKQLLHSREHSNISYAKEQSNLVTPREHTTYITPRETSNLVKTRNLGISRENLGASQESLNREETVLTKKPMHASVESLTNLQADIKTRQTSLENLKTREENGRSLYTFTLQKQDRSYSEPMIFPPLSETHKTKASHGHHKHDSNVNDSKEYHTPILSRLHHKENTNIPIKDRKPPTGIKFPVVSRSDLYKHLGITHETRKRKKQEANDRMTKEEYSNRYKHTPKILPESGGSRMAIPLSNPYGRGPEQMAKNKVEMYKQWHEEQNKHKVKKGNMAETTRDAMKLASVYREKYNPAESRNKHGRNASRREETLPKIGLRNTIQNDKVTRSNAPSRMETSLLQASKLNPGHKNSNVTRTESPPAQIPEELLNRVYSAKTWKTWRDINESYSYSNVHEYIEDNELMDEEKEDWIKLWITNVDKKYFNPTPPDSDAEEEEIDTDSKSRSGQSQSQPEHATISEAEESGIIIEKAEAITRI